MTSIADRRERNVDPSFLTVQIIHRSLETNGQQRRMYLEPIRTSTIFAKKSSIVDVRLGSKYNSAMFFVLWEILQIEISYYNWKTVASTEGSGLLLKTSQKF